MTKNKTTKSALTLSIVALVICFTMLLGTTFAWFTDSVTSSNNIIKTGELKVGLEYRNFSASATTGQLTLSEWANAEDVGTILDPDALYEPGYVSASFFKVENKGNLALKYQLAALKASEKAGINAYGRQFYISDYLVFKFVKLDDNTAIKPSDLDNGNLTREKAIELLDGDNDTGYSIPNIVNALLPKAEGETENPSDVCALVVYMPETVGNEAKALDTTDANTPELQLNFKLVATQYSYEKDSFDQYYDKEAFNDDWNVYQYITGDITTGLSAYETKFDPKPRVTVTNAAITDEVSLSVSECNSPYNLRVVSGSTYVSYDIKVKDANGATPAGIYTVKMYVGDLEGQDYKLYHNGVEFDGSKRLEGEQLVFETDQFSVFTVAVTGVVARINDNYYATLNDALNRASDNDTVYLTSKVLQIPEDNGEVNFKSGKKVTLDLNGCALSVSNGTSSAITIASGSDLTIMDSSAKGNGVVSLTGGIIEEPEAGIGGNDQNPNILIDNKGKLTIDGGVIKCNVSADNNTNTWGLRAIVNTGDLIVNGGEIAIVKNNGKQSSGSGIHTIHSTAGTVTINDGLVKVESNAPKTDAIYSSDTVLTVNGGKIVTKCTVEVGNNYAAGIYATNTGKVELNNFDIDVDDSMSSIAAGLYVQSNNENVPSIVVKNGTVDVHTKNGTAYGIDKITAKEAAANTDIIDNVTINATSDNGPAYGVTKHLGNLNKSETTYKDYKNYDDKLVVSNCDITLISNVESIGINATLGVINASEVVDTTFDLSSRANNRNIVIGTALNDVKISGVNAKVDSKNGGTISAIIMSNADHAVIEGNKFDFSTVTIDSRTGYNGYCYGIDVNDMDRAEGDVSDVTVKDTDLIYHFSGYKIYAGNVSVVFLRVPTKLTIDNTTFKHTGDFYNSFTTVRTLAPDGRIAEGSTGEVRVID